MLTYSLFSFANREERNRGICRIFRPYIQGKVLDVGCDKRYISKYAICDYYIGIDLYGNPDIRVNLEEGLPFSDKAFDTVICLEVLEHIDRFHFLFNELCRAAKNYVIIGLPNMYYWRWRLTFLFGRKISEKYGLPLDPPKDRHRWLFSLNEAQEWLKISCKKAGFKVVSQGYGFFQYRSIIGRFINKIELILSLFIPNAMAAGFYAVLEREKS